MAPSNVAQTMEEAPKGVAKLAVRYLVFLDSEVAAET